MKRLLYSRLRAMLTLLTAVLLGGCTGGTGLSGGGTSGLGVAPAQTMTVFGIANVGTESLEGSTVAVLADGSPLQLQESATVKNGGHFRAVVTPVVPGGTWTVQITTRGGEVLRTEVEASARSTGSAFVHVNLLTTLCTAFHALHPELTKTEARDRVLSWLHIPARAQLGDEVVHSRLSRFAQVVYLRRARQHAEGLAGYTRTVAGLIGAPGNPGGYDDYQNDENFDDEVEVVQNVANAATAIEKVPSLPVIDEFSVLTAGIGKVCSAMGTVFKLAKGLYDLCEPSPLQVALEAILNRLDELSDQIARLGNQIAQEFNQTNYNTLAGNLSAPISRISQGMSCVQNMAQYASMAPPDVTNYDGNVQRLNSGTSPGGIGFNLSQILTDAQTIHDTEIPQQPGVTPLLTLASEICGTNLFVADPQYTTFQNHVNYYVGRLIQAASVIQAMAAPTQIGTYPNFANNFVGTPAYAANSSASYISWTNTSTTSIPDNIQQEMSILPYPLSSSSCVLDVTNKACWGSASTPVGEAAGVWDSMLASMQVGGVSGFTPASSDQMKALYHLADALYGGSGTPSSYSAVLNNYGFKLQPGVISAQVWASSDNVKWYQKKDETFCQNGFLTVDTSPVSGKPGTINYTLGWIDDTGKTGTIGTGTIAYPLYEELLAPHNVFMYDTREHLDGDLVFTQWNCGLITAPFVYRVDLSASTPFTQPSFAFVPLGCYNGLTLQAGAQTADYLSNGSSYTQPLAALPNGTSGAATFSNQYPVTNEVFWQSSRPTIAPISNVVPTASASPAPTPEYPQVPNAAGTIHWLPASAGQSVTFTASRYLPNGTKVTGTVTLQSPVGLNPTAPTPDGIQVWPSVYNIYAADLQGAGLQLYVSRHFGNGSFEDVATKVGSGGTNVQYVSDTPNVNVNASGLVTSTAPITDGTTITLTITDPTVPASTDAAHTRRSVTAIIKVVAK